MNNIHDPSRKSSPDNDREETTEEAKKDKQRSDPPLTEIKGVTDPEEYVEPPVEEEPKKQDWVEACPDGKFIGHWIWSWHNYLKQTPYNSKQWIISFAH